MLTAMFAAVLATADLHFTPPGGWTFQKPPQEMIDQRMVAIWHPPIQNGENIMVSIFPRSVTQTLADSQKGLIQEETADGRERVSVAKHPTCNGKVNGVDVTMRFAWIAYQFYHLAITRTHVYSIAYTHSIADKKPNPAVIQAIDSLCPG